MADVSHFESEAELDALLEAFEAAKIPNECWTHRDHVAVATLILLQRGGMDEIRAGIQKLNAANGVEVTPTGGFHETITFTWTILIGHYITFLEGSRLEVVNAAIDAFTDKAKLLEYYSRDRIMSPEARYGWVEPDLKPLPGS